MKELQEGRRFKKLLHSRYAIIFLIVLLVLLGRGVWGVYVKYQKSLEIKERAEYDLKILAEREDSLTQAISSLKTDEGKERELRDRFGVVKEGERIVVIIDDTEQRENDLKSEEGGFWKKFLDLFR